MKNESKKIKSNFKRQNSFLLFDILIWQICYLLIPKELMSIFRKESSNIILKVFRKTNCSKE